MPEPTPSDDSLSPERVARRYDHLASFYGLLSAVFFLRSKVRREAVDNLALQAGDSVLEVGCGTGSNFSMLVDKVGPGGRVLGIDASPGMLRRAEDRVQKGGWTQVSLRQQDASELDAPAQLDAVFFSLSYSVLPDRRSTLQQAWRLLRPGGRLVILDAGLPDSRFWRRLNAPLRLVSRATVLGDPEARPWEDLTRLAEAVEFRRFVPGTYFVCAATR